MDVEATRKARGLSRKQLAQLAGVTESTVWSVEHGKNPRGGEDARQAVLRVLDPMAQPTEAVSSTPENHDGKVAGQLPAARSGKKLGGFETERPDWTYRYEWNGILNGDACRIAGETGTARFRYHVVTDEGNTHVTVTLDGKWRCFEPDRMLPANKGKRRSPGEGTNGVTDWVLEVLALSGETHTSTFASYRDAREQCLQHEVPAGGKCKIINHLGTVVEVQPKGWTTEVGQPQEVSA